NAVNLTDGLDGLAIMPIVLVATGLGVFAYLAGDVRFANYLHIPYVKYSSELVVVCAAMIGAGLAFLWYNAHPAQVFMGDVGALSLGAMLGTIAVMVRQEIVFAIMAGVFVVEAVSVFLQIGSLRMRNKRVFLMAPLHHPYEKKGWRETQVVIRFWIITIMLVVLGLMTLKLRYEMHWKQSAHAGFFVLEKMMNLLMCPVCRKQMSLNERTWRCENHHSYDVAKQSYVNLHVVQHKHSKNPGDTPESVQARRAFLSAGYYAPLQQAVVEKIRDLRIENLLDIGCGEGY